LVDQKQPQFLKKGKLLVQLPEGELDEEVHYDDNPAAALEQQ
jgi:hypothetical protein